LKSIISTKTQQLASLSKVKFLAFFACILANSHFVLAQDTNDTTAPILTYVGLSPDSVELNPNSSDTQEISLSLTFEDENLVRVNTFYLQNLANNEQIEFTQVGSWEITNNTHSATFVANIAPTNSTGTWYLSSLVATDSLNNSNADYDTLEDLLLARLAPFVSVLPNTSTQNFDATLEAQEGFSQSMGAQTSYLDLTIQDAVEYEIWFVPNANTSFTDIVFSEAISLSQACSTFSNYTKCKVTSSNNNNAILAQIDTQAAELDTFGYSVYVVPTGQGYESDWLTNLVIFPPEDFDNDGIPNEQDLDDDNDGVSDLLDLFPLDPSETVDADLDGIGDNADTDDDNDDVPDEMDAFPFDATENNDNDNDGIGDNADTDDDNDNVLDSEDAFPFDPTETIDTDNDGIGNNADNDDDNDGGLDDNDAFPLDPTETIDSDNDGIGNNADLDDDNDGTPDVNDAFTRDPTEDTDTDEDGIGNNADEDDDNDGINDIDDEFPLDAGDARDNDQDGIGDNADLDDDNDDFPDLLDAFPFNPNENADFDNDGIGDNADPDDDNDGLDDAQDRFPKDASEVADFDNDNIGNNADTDDDNDGVLDVVDAFPFAVTEWFDTDNDGIGNNADLDDDNDGVDDEFDAFDNDPTETIDNDSDGIGNNADPDDDNDGVVDTLDAFPLDPSESLDTDNDGVGNNTDTDDDGDLVADESDLFPLDRTESADNDLDGIGNNADLDDDNDTVLDVDDAFPFDAGETLDTDTDGIGDNADTDDDNDGFDDANDLFPLDETEWADNDLDGQGDNRDIDDDNDGVIDTEDAFVFDPSETLDNDEDGIGNNADTDDDNDGVLDEADAFPFSPAETSDTDNDGIGNNADSDDDNDGIVDEDDIQPLNPTIGDDEAPTLDGISDIVVEATGPLTPITLDPPRVRDNNLNPASLSSSYEGPLPLGEHVITWTAIDFAGNRSELDQNVTVQDTTPPVFSELAVIEIASRGLLTDVSIDINETAFDLVEGTVTAVVVTENNLKAGRQSVMLQATDASGNSAITELALNILPSITAKPSGFTSPGSLLQIPVVLSGKAPEYPVSMEFTVVGPVVSATSGILEITEGQLAYLSLEVAQTANLGEQVFVNFANPQNAVIANMSQINLLVTNVNQAPVTNIKLLQNQEVMSFAYQDQGDVTLLANINDINFDDSHNVNWQIAAHSDRSRSISIVDANSDNNSATLVFDPSILPIGDYVATAVIQETNTTEQFSVQIEFAFTIDESRPVLSATIDSDFDGLTDQLEGLIDSDLDGIPDYLDNEANTATLPTGASEQALTTIPGYRLTIGDIAKLSNTQNANNASISSFDIESYGVIQAFPNVQVSDPHFDPIQQILNFNIENLETLGESVPVIIPLNTGTVIPSNAFYRKFNSRDGWYTFVENAQNTILSSAFDDDGNCPEPNSSSYLSGLNTGDTCIQLVIQDGGPNDADLATNGIIKDPGVLSSGRPNRSPLISVAQQTTVFEGETLRVDASLTSDIENDTLLFNWVQIGGLRIDVGENISPLLSFVAPQVDQTEILLFRLDVFDGRDTSSANVTVTIRNQNTAPTVTIGAHSDSVNESSQITLNALANDSDNDVLRYEWRQTSGPAAVLSGQSSSSLTLTMPQVNSRQTITIAIYVFDGEKEVSFSTSLTIEDTNAPVVAGSPASDSGGGSLGFYSLFCAVLIGLYRRRKCKSLIERDKN
jgi:hypothetical protein